MSDECYTHWDTWDDLERFMPRHKTLYDPFNGSSFVSWAEGKGLTAIGGNDFWGDHGENNHCVVVSNPPFTCRHEVIHTLLERGQPFILLVPYSTLRMNVLNAISNMSFVFWGQDQTYSYPNLQTRKTRLMCLMSGIDAPPYTWIAAPVKPLKATLCECGTLVEPRHMRFQERQKWLSDHSDHSNHSNHSSPTDQPEPVSI